ncbi:unnamed protein product [Coregonus sp. 'balchen']|nr:unnamed protein product [Coregonus sp. 'balchen']
MRVKPINNIIVISFVTQGWVCPLCQRLTSCGARWKEGQERSQCLPWILSLTSPSLRSARTEYVVLGKSVGIVTTTRVQHASPAAAYAHSVSRSGYSDTDIPSSAHRQGCVNIATQLVTNIDIDVRDLGWGGGRMYMTPKGTPDPEYPTSSSRKGDRKDKWNLIDDKNFQYVWHRKHVDEINIKTTDRLLAKGHAVRDFRNATRDPSIVEMTNKNIRILSKNPKGYFLFLSCSLRGGIDHRHHDGIAKLALTEVLMPTTDSDTLTVITVDHSHVFTFGGNSPCGNSIFGMRADDRMPFTSILYANGPSYVHTHSGEDVAIYAKGPMVHLFHGVKEQNYISHAMAYGVCIQPYTDCHPHPPASAGHTQTLSGLLLCLASLLWLLFR